MAEDLFKDLLQTKKIAQITLWLRNAEPIVRIPKREITRIIATEHGLTRPVIGRRPEAAAGGPYWQNDLSKMFCMRIGEIRKLMSNGYLTASEPVSEADVLAFIERRTVGKPLDPRSMLGQFHSPVDVCPRLKTTIKDLWNGINVKAISALNLPLRTDFGYLRIPKCELDRLIACWTEGQAAPDDNSENTQA